MNYLNLLILALLSSLTGLSAHAQLHSPVICSSSATLGTIDWSTSPSGDSQFDWNPNGALTNTFSDVSGTGVVVDMTFTGETATFGSWSGTQTPSVGSNPTNGAEECLMMYTDGYNNGISLTMNFNVPVRAIGFDLANVNSLPGFNGDIFTITAINELGQTIYPTLTPSANPSYTVDNFGNIDANASSVAGDNDEVGINLSDANSLISFTIFWGNCSTCSPNFVHGLGIKDIEFCVSDFDNDHLMDAIDIDDDNDGIPDLLETGGIDPLGDNDGDNVYAYIDDNDNDPTIFNNDGLIESIFDFDGDNFANHLDLDADNDGISDIVEAGGDDPDGDGNVFYPVPNVPSSMNDQDFDGLADEYDSNISPVLVLTETGDCSGQTNGYTHNISYNTGTDDATSLVTLTFCMTGDYGNAITETLTLTGEGGTFLGSFSKLNSDNPNYGDCGAVPFCITTTIPQLLWNQWNNDGVVQLALTPSAAVNFCTDYSCLDQATVSYTRQVNPGTDIPLFNTDQVGNPDQMDLDSDNDGIGDNVELHSGDDFADRAGGASIDGMVGNGAFADANQNGWADSHEGPDSRPDFDGDGLPDGIDIDADNDGIKDIYESVCSTCTTFGNETTVDSDGDGFSDQFEGLTNENQSGGSNQGVIPNDDWDDSDGSPDYIDLDSDGDGAFDWSEGYDTSGNGDANPEFPDYATNYALAGGAATDYPISDIDGDGLPDFTDNQPATAGYIEQDRPPFLDPTSIYYHDDDNDGLVDLLDTDINGNNFGTQAPLPDNDGINDRDWRDINNLVILLPSELIYFEVSLENRKVRVDWTTASEFENYYFEILRSTDLAEWTSIGKVDGAGTSNSVIDYTFWDSELPSGTTYYRLKMVSTSFDEEFSDIRSLHLSNEVELVLFPNPATDKVTILSPDAGMTQIDLIGLSGAMATSTEITDKNIQTLDLLDLPNGSYMMHIQFSDGSEVTRSLIVSK